MSCFSRDLSGVLLSNLGVLKDNILVLKEFSLFLKKGIPAIKELLIADPWTKDRSLLHYLLH